MKCVYHEGLYSLHTVVNVKNRCEPRRDGTRKSLLFISEAVVSLATGVYRQFIVQLFVSSVPGETGHVEPGHVCFFV